MFGMIAQQKHPNKDFYSLVKRKHNGIRFDVLQVLLGDFPFKNARDQRQQASKHLVLVYE